jgi:hypothetical protein
MTQTDYGDFAASLHRLGRAFSKPVEAEMIQDYFDDLKGYSLGLVEEALTHVRQTSRFWPRPVVILDACIEASRARASRSDAVPATVNHDDDRYACDVCLDTGFERKLECDGTGVCRIDACANAWAVYTQARSANPVADIDRPYAHAFTRRCVCRATNPVLVREREATRRPAPGGQA